MRSSIAIAAAIIGAVNAAPGGGYGYGGGYESVVYSTSTPAPSSTEAPVYSAPAYTPAPSSSEAPVYSAPAYTPVPSSSEAPVYSAPAYSAPAPAYSAPAPVYSAPAYNASVAVPYVTKTVYATSLNTATTSGSVVVYTTVVPVYTTVCPATETPTLPASYSAWVPESSVYAAESTSTSCDVSSTVTVVVPVSTPAASGTGYVPYPSGATAIWGTAASSSGYLKPSATYPAEFTGAASHANAGMAVAGLGALAALFL